jgi:hypothetical protein
MSRERDNSIVGALVSQITALTGPDTRLIHVQEREWASVTFSGARYTIQLSVPAREQGRPPLLAAIAALPEHEFTLRGVIVADCSATIGGLLPRGNDDLRRAITVEVLTVVAD